jgi:2-polyprenyl-6-methoxyphenol hydroxylase-like FAD-dependent oxidoreductase
VIVGGGVGGLTTALALRRVGIDSIVCEREVDLARAQVGGCFSLYSNGMRPLQELGLKEEMLKIGSVLTRSEVRTPRGRMLGVADLGNLERRFDSPSVGASRTDTHRVLTSALGEEAIRMGASCNGYSQESDGIVATFADGSVEEGDILIGADGLRSTIRAQQFGQEQPRYAGYTVWQGIAEKTHAAFPTDAVVLCMGSGLRFVVYPVRDGRPYWAALLTTRQGGQDPEGGSKQAVRDLFSDWFPAVGEVIEQTPESAISRTDNFGRDPIESWGEGRVTLLGDAAHATTINIGQGACQAIEDAFTLAECAQSEPDFVSALRRYESRRVGRTAAIMKFAWQVGAVGQWANPIAVQARKQFLRLGWKRLMQPQFDDRVGSVDLFR